MDATIALKIAALIAALTAITTEDIEAIKQEQTLGPDVAINIQNFQNYVQQLDQQTIDMLNEARVQAGLPTV